MSELRQRRGGGDGDGEKPPQGLPQGMEKLLESEDTATKEEVIQRVNQLITRMKPNPKPGLTNIAKKAKDALAEDPYDMEKIFELGNCYANDEQWDRCANVLLRGWKRMDEISDPSKKFQYLMILCEASLQCKKYRQALAVMNDTDKLDDVPKPFEALKCKVYCMNGELTKALKAFNRAIEDETLDTAGIYWTSCCQPLKKVGGYEATKSLLENLAKTDEERNKLQALEKIAEFKEELMEAEVRNAMSQREKTFVGIIIALVVLACFYGLYLLEKRSLEGMKKK